MLRTTDYTPQYLTTEARRIVKGVGKYQGHSIKVHNSGATLVARYVRTTDAGIVPGTVTVAL